MKAKPAYSGLLLFLSTLCASVSVKASLADTVEMVEPAIVAIGTYSRVASPNSAILGTGFAVTDGLHIATNAHVIPDNLDGEKKETLVVFVGKGRTPQRRQAEVVALDSYHDLALLKINGTPLSPLLLSGKKGRSGDSIAFTGYPIGAVLGLYPVTHRGIISSITPVVIPVRSSKELTIKQLKQLKDPYLVYQLDATAYPGNSGSPVYDQESGEVIAVVNKVLVKSTKEAVLSDPSAITYAIPINYLKAMIDAQN